MQTVKVGETEGEPRYERWYGRMDDHNGLFQPTGGLGTKCLKEKERREDRGQEEGRWRRHRGSMIFF